MFKKFLSLALFALLPTLAVAQATDNASFVQQLKAGESLSAVMPSQLSGKANVGQVVFSAIKHGGANAADVVAVASDARPDKLEEIVKAAIQADPDQIQTILTRLLTKVKRSDVMRVVVAAVQAAPAASQDIITAAVVSVPDMVEEIVVGVAEQVIAISESSDDFSSDFIAIDKAKPGKPAKQKRKIKQLTGTQKQKAKQLARLFKKAEFKRSKSDDGVFDRITLLSPDAAKGGTGQSN